MQCPSDRELQEFATGQCEVTQIELIGDHLETCGSCTARVNQLESDPDDLLKKLEAVDFDDELVDSQFDEVVRQVDLASDQPDSGTRALDDSKRESPSWASGTRIGDYVLLDEIARGGMGIVFRARQTALGRVVALKMIASGQLANQEQVARFKTEAAAAAQLDHPHIVPVYDIGHENGHHFFSMGYVSGPSLQEVLRDGPLAAREAAELLVLIAEAVHFAHEKNILHRDLKPANILLSKAEEGAKGSSATAADSKRRVSRCLSHPRITDFGLAKRFDLPDSVTTTGQIMGTPAFMAPEQARGDNAIIGVAADTYALGAVLYAALVGRPPFQAANAVRTIRQVVEEDPVAPRQLNAEVDRDLETICLKCLEKDPSRRYSTAADLSADLHRYLQGQPIVARPISRVTRVVRWANRNRAQAGLIGVGLVALVALAALTVAMAYQGELETTNEQVTSARDRLRESNAQLGDTTEKLLSSNDSLTKSLEREKTLVSRLQSTNSRLDDLLKREKTLRKDLAQQKSLVDKLIYFKRVTLAYEEWKNNELRRARQLLDDCPLSLRHWEWHYVYHLCNSEKLRIDTQHGGSNRWQFGLNPDTTLIATPENSDVAIWDAASGKRKRTLKGHKSHVESVAFSPNGKLVASGGQDETLRVWDVATGKLEHTFLLANDRRSPWVRNVAFRTDGSGAACIHQGKILLCDLKTGKHSEIQPQDKRIECFAFSPDGERIVSATQREVFVSNVDDREVVLSNKLSRIAKLTEAVKFNSKGTMIACARHDSLLLLDASSGKVLRELKGHSQRINDVAFSPDGTHLATAGRDRTIRVWSVDAGDLLVQFPAHTAWAGCVRFSRTQPLLVSAGNSGAVRIWNARGQGHLVATTFRGKWNPRFHTQYMIHSVAFDSRGDQFYSGNWDHSIKLWSTDGGPEVSSFEGQPSVFKAVRSLDVSADGKRLVAAGADETVRVWDTTNRRELLVFRGHKGAVLTAKFSPDGQHILSGGVDRLIKLWNSETGEVIRTFHGHIETLLEASLSPDGSHVVSTASDGVRLWDAKTGKMLFRLQQRYGFRGSAFHPNGEWVASAGHDRTVWLWNLKTHRIVRKFSGHRAWIEAVCFSPDGKRMFTAGMDDALGVWDVETGTEIIMLRDHGNGLDCVAISRSGQRVVTGSRDGTVKLWDARSGQW